MILLLLLWNRARVSNLMFGRYDDDEEDLSRESARGTNKFNNVRNGESGEDSSKNDQ